MSRGPHRFRSAEVERALRAAQRVAEPTSLRIAKDGSITVGFGRPKAVEPNGDVNEWDTVLAHDTPAA